MIDDYFTDRVKILTRTVDAANRATETENTVNARAEKTDQLIQGENGENIRAQWMIFFPAGTSIDMGARIQVTEVDGISFVTRKFPIASIYIANGFTSSHIEVMA